MADLGNLSDNELAGAACQGDRAAFPILVERYVGVLSGFFHYLGASPSQVDDLVQEAFYRAFRNLESYDRKRSFSNWFLSIARYLYYEAYRKEKKREQPLENVPATCDPGIEARAVDRAMVEQALARLPEEGRLIIELRVYKDLPFADIGKLTGETEGALRVRFHRTMKLLRTMLERG